MTQFQVLFRKSFFNVYHAGFDKALKICYDNGTLRSHPRITVFFFFVPLMFIPHHFYCCNKSRVHLLIFLDLLFFLFFNLAGMAGS